MKDFENFHDKYVIFGGDFNIVFEKNLESAGGTFLKKHSLPLSFKLNKTFNLCDIWRVRNPHKNLLTLQQKHLTGIIQHRLDYLFVSNTLQESVEKKKKFLMLYHPVIPPFSVPLLTAILLFMDQVCGNSIILYCSILIFFKN